MTRDVKTFIVCEAGILMMHIWMDVESNLNVRE